MNNLTLADVIKTSGRQIAMSLVVLSLPPRREMQM